MGVCSMHKDHIVLGPPPRSSKSGKASFENCSLSATSTAYNSINSILQFLQDLRGSSSAVGLLRIVLRSERRHYRAEKTKRNAHKTNENGAEKVNATDDTDYN